MNVQKFGLSSWEEIERWVWKGDNRTMKWVTRLRKSYGRADTTKMKHAQQLITLN